MTIMHQQQQQHLQFEQEASEQTPLDENTRMSINKVGDVNRNVDGKEIRLSFKRWIILLIFSLISMMSAFNWIQYSIIQDIVIDYYNASLPLTNEAKNEAINWTSMVYMLCYIPLIFPTMFLLDHKGLKLSICLGAVLNALGACIKCLAINPNRFAIAMLGQTVCAIAQAFTLGIPARLSSVWFGDSEIAKATSIGVFGNQFGTALGFLIPPSIVPNNVSSIEQINNGFYYLFYSNAAFCTLLAVLAIVFVSNRPLNPSNRAQAQYTQNECNQKATLMSFKKSLINLIRNQNFVLILISYGINTGSYYSISTLLNQILISYYKNENEKIGYIGLVLVLSGLVGALVAGYALDKTKAFKLTTFIIYLLTFASMILFTLTIDINIWIVFATAYLLGFFMTGYLPVGFEFAAELTYPEPEGTSSGLLNLSAQIFGIAFVYAQSRMTTTIGVLYSNLFLCVTLLIGTIITGFIRPIYKRQNALTISLTINNK